MKFEKAIVEIIEKVSSDVITTSGAAVGCCNGLVCDDLGI